VVSEEASVASAQVRCAGCGERIEVICLYCMSGVDAELDEAMTMFTLSHVSAMDEALALLPPCGRRGCRRRVLRQSLPALRGDAGR
jgi:hypothetical protein